ETAGQVERDSGLDTLRGLLPDLLDRPANGALHGEIVLDDPIGGQGSPARAPREHSFHAAFDLIAAGVGEGNLVWGSGWSGQHAQGIHARHILREQRKRRCWLIDRPHAPGEVLELARAADERSRFANDRLSGRIVRKVEALDLVLLEAGAADDRKLLADLQAIFGIDRPGLGVSAVPRLHAVTLVEAAGIEVLRIDGVRRRRKAVMRVLDVEHVDVDAHYKLVRQAVAQRGVELHMRLAA